ncbi:ABC transporter permease [Lyngbya aestuarii]|uniref:ABC transporter permease n=1 Tax=Lyngbya aestuarii TaxID=118322 RepID=UPI00058FDE47|nr:ABC transporter permease [Lyngbya aestuarii]
MTLLPQNQSSPKSVETRKQTTLLILLLPTTIWLLIFFVLPIIFVLVCSFLQRGTYGGINWIFTLDNYQRLISPLYGGVFWQSLQLAALTTIVCLIIAYPLAFFIVTRPERWRNILLGLVVIPFWTNFLVRTYAWIIILGNEGVINSILDSLKLIDEPIDLLFTPFAVIIGLIYGYLPFMVLPLYATLERFDFSLVEAAQDLGSNHFWSFWRVIFPLTQRGIIAGSILVFIPAFGAFITPDILGGAKTLMVGNLIQNQFLQARNWPFGSALSMILMGVILIPILIYLQSHPNDY